MIAATFFSLYSRLVHLIYPLLGSVDGYDMSAVREVVDVFIAMGDVRGEAAPVSALPLAPVPK